MPPPNLSDGHDPQYLQRKMLAVRKERIRIVRDGRPVSALIYQHDSLDRNCRMRLAYEAALYGIRREIFESTQRHERLMTKRTIDEAAAATNDPMLHLMSRVMALTADVRACLPNAPWIVVELENVCRLIDRQRLSRDHARDTEIWSSRAKVN